MTRVVFLIYFLKQNFDLLFILNVAMDKYHVLAEPMTIIQKVNRKSQIWGLGGFAAEICSPAQMWFSIYLALMKTLGNPLFQRGFELWEAISPSSRGVRSSSWTFWKALNVYFRLCNNLEPSGISPKNGTDICSHTPPWAWSQNHRLQL